jgi:hypothetical protein
MQPYPTQLVLEALENGIERKVLRPSDVGTDVLKGFWGEFGRKFYGEPAPKQQIRVKIGQEILIQASSFGTEEQKIVPFMLKEPCIFFGMDMRSIGDFSEFEQIF